MKCARRLTPNRLRKYRLLSGYDQQEVAFLLGLKSHAQISEWERGVSKPGLDNLLCLSLIYRTLPDELYYDVRYKHSLQIRRREQLLQIKKDEGG